VCEPVATRVGDRDSVVVKDVVWDGVEELVLVPETKWVAEVVIDSDRYSDIDRDFDNDLVTVDDLELVMSSDWLVLLVVDLRVDSLEDCEVLLVADLL